MRFGSTILLLFVAFILTNTTCGQQNGPGLVQACGETREIFVPVEFEFAPAPDSTEVPLIPDPDAVGISDTGNTSRFQQWVSTEALPPRAMLHRIRFRVDESTPPSSFAGDLSFAVEVSLANGPKDRDDMLILFDRNFTSKPMKVFDGVVTVAGTVDDPGVGKPEPGLVEIVFEEAYFYEAGLGPLLIDMRISGSFGEPLPVLFDGVATAKSSQSIAYYSPIDIPVRTYRSRCVPVISLLASPVEATSDSLAECLSMLPLKPELIGDLLGRFGALNEALLQDSIALGQTHANKLGPFIEQLESDGLIGPETRATLDSLSAEYVYANVASLIALGRLHEQGIRNEFGVGIYNFHRISAGFVADVPDSEVLLAQANEVQDEFRVTVNTDTVSPEFRMQYKRMLEAFCRQIEALAGREDIDEEHIQVARDLKELIRDPADLLLALNTFIEIVEDLRLDGEDSEEIRLLKSVLGRMARRASEEGEVRETTEQIIRVLCELATYLDSGDLVSISIETIDGKLIVDIDVEDPIEIRLAEFIDLDTMTWYGKTNIYVDIHVKKDSKITFCDEGPDENGKDVGSVSFDPSDGIDVDFDSSGIFVIDLVEEQLGDIDLDKLCLHEIRLEDCKIVFTGESKNKDVKITMDSETVEEGPNSSSGVTIEVDGVTVLPQ